MYCLHRWAIHRFSGVPVKLDGDGCDLLASLLSYADCRSCIFYSKQIMPKIITISMGKDCKSRCLLSMKHLYMYF